MSGHKSKKKGPNIICRVSNVTPEMVCRYVKRLPKQKMKENSFRSFMGTGWFQNEHQAPEQWGLYYIDGTDYYPRFNHDITIDEAKAYLYHWMRNLIVINPYTRFKTQNDKNLVESIVSQLEKNPNEHDLKTIIRRIIDSDEPFVINEIIANALNTFSRALKVDIIDKDKERFNVSLLPNYKELLNTSNMTKKEYFELFDSSKTAFDSNVPLQQIFYGAPGTGKSHKIKDNAIVKNADGKQLVFRTTFHPDSDYSTFVGAYKPTMKPVDDKYKAVAGRDEEITYSFVPQTFLQAYIAAWNNPEEPVFLIIEEINRGNCAQIFGDLFQLLDRDNEGFSEYPIMADNDLKKYLNGKNEYGQDVLTNKDGIKDNKLNLPKNLYIWATMNTSDQSLFPIDSAFKRRWDWEYMPIGYKNTNWIIEIGTKKYNWVDFQREINNRIYSVDNSEDKQLGDYFVNADRTGNKISADTLLNKILFYLWNDVCKDDPDQIFKWDDDKDNNQEKSIKFSDFFDTEKERKLQGFMAFLNIKAIEENQENVELVEDESSEENDNDVNL